MEALRGFLILVLTAAIAAAQPELRLKTKHDPHRGFATRSLNSRRAHWLLQFDRAIGTDDIDELRRRGANVLRLIPDTGALISAESHLSFDDLPLLRAERWTQIDKLSPDLAPGPSLVEFHPDVTYSEARSVLAKVGIEIVDHPQLLDGHFIVNGSAKELLNLASWDEVEYILPADRALLNGEPVHVCGGALMREGTVGQMVATIGSWSPGRAGIVDLSYAYGVLSRKIDRSQLQQQIQKALAEWSKQVKVNFTATTNLAAARTLAFRWGRGPIPFDGPGKMLAYTYYPSPPNAEPIAGDLYFDDDENWQIGTDIDVFSVILHEIGHALGLGHSDVPGSVMYSYYRRVSMLTAEDIRAIRTLYAPREATAAPNTPVAPPVTPDPPKPTVPGDRTPPSLTVSYPATPVMTTSLAKITAIGTARDESAIAEVTWTTSLGATGVADGTNYWKVEIPLVPGLNSVVIRAHDTAGNSSWRSLVITRR